jgi:hypothetical protein
MAHNDDQRSIHEKPCRRHHQELLHSTERQQLHESHHQCFRVMCSIGSFRLLIELNAKKIGSQMPSRGYSTTCISPFIFPFYAQVWIHTPLVTQIMKACGCIHPEKTGFVWGCETPEHHQVLEISKTSKEHGKSRKFPANFVLPTV